VNKTGYSISLDLISNFDCGAIFENESKSRRTFKKQKKDYAIGHDGSRFGGQRIEMGCDFRDRQVSADMLAAVSRKHGTAAGWVPFAQSEKKKGLFLIRTAAQSFDPGRCASVKIYFGMIGDWPAGFMLF